MKPEQDLGKFVQVSETRMTCSERGNHKLKKNSLKRLLGPSNAPCGRSPLTEVLCILEAITMTGLFFAMVSAPPSLGVSETH